MTATNASNTAQEEELEEEFLEFNIGDSGEQEVEEHVKHLDHAQSTDVTHIPDSPAHSEKRKPSPLPIATKGPREEHIDRLKRREDQNKVGSLGSMGFNHSKSLSVEEKDAPGPLRGLSGGAFGLINGEPQSVQTPTTPMSDEWQSMPTVASYEIYDEKGAKVVVRHDDFEATQAADNADDVENGGSKYGYTRVTIDDDVKSVTSMDENTENLFDEDEFKRSPLAQLDTTKGMLTEGQKIAYVGLCKLAMVGIAQGLMSLKGSKKIHRKLSSARGAMFKWSQSMMMRLYAHMDISSDGKQKYTCFKLN